MSLHSSAPWWADMGDLLDQPADDYRERLEARNNALFPRLRDERGPLVELDHAAVDA